MATHRSASALIHEQNDELITPSTTITSTTTDDMEDIELAEPKDGPESERKRIRGLIKKLIIQLVVFTFFFCLLCFGGWAFISVTVDWLPNICHKKGGHVVEHHNATGNHKWVCEGIDGFHFR